jgi:hypothetical protein
MRRNEKAARTNPDEAARVAITAALRTASELRDRRVETASSC